MDWFCFTNFNSLSVAPEKQNMPSLKSHRIKRGLMKLVPKWKNDQAGKSFYLFFIGSCFMFASFLANAVSLSFPQFTSEQLTMCVLCVMIRAEQKNYSNMPFKALDIKVWLIF